MDLILIITSRYEFFLDEVIAIRNRYLVEVQARKGYHPHIQPEEVLLARRT